MPKLDAFGGGPIFDLRFLGYDRTAAEALLRALGTEGRAFYLNAQQWLDTAFPAVLGAALDYAENSLVRGMLASGTADGVEWASRMTLMKSAVGAVVLAAALLLVMAAALRQFRGRT